MSGALVAICVLKLASSTMGRHDHCGAPVGISQPNHKPISQLPTCVLSTQHKGQHMDKDGNREAITIIKRLKAKR